MTSPRFLLTSTLTGLVSLFICITPSWAQEKMRAASALKGTLTLPVQGEVILRYGEKNMFGRVSHGTVFSIKASQPVKSPAPGTVISARPHSQFGTVIILNIGDGHHITLANLISAAVKTEERVAQGAMLGAVRVKENIDSLLLVELRNPTGATEDFMAWVAAPTPIKAKSSLRDNERDDLDPSPYRTEGERCGGEFLVKACQPGLVCDRGALSSLESRGQHGVCVPAEKLGTSMPTGVPKSTSRSAPNPTNSDSAALRAFEKVAAEVVAAGLKKISNTMVAMHVYKASEKDFREEFDRFEQKLIATVAPKMAPSQIRSRLPRTQAKIAQIHYTKLTAYLSCVVEYYAPEADKKKAVEDCIAVRHDEAKSLARLQFDYGDKLGNHPDWMRCEAKYRLLDAEKHYPPFKHMIVEGQPRPKAIDAKGFLSCFQGR